MYSFLRHEFIITSKNDYKIDLFSSIIHSMKAMNAIYAQSGGVTSVINTTACGVIETARKSKNINKLYAGKDGIVGILNEEIIDTNQIAALIDKAKEESAEVEKNKNKLTQSNIKNSFATGLTLSEEDALRAQIFGCWTVPLGQPLDEDLLVRIKLEIKKDGNIIKSEILDHERMNRPGQKFYKILAESALRAVRICQPLRVPQTGYEKWKNIQLNFNPTEMLKG